ncbi:hypothetical protein J4573_50460 [Actinomadura barringtoniae]|uniref:Uncharacterized protein n=1 Tax=Actinomadura barringtoniae TaxID=1427535 RepID=A0A939TAG4_9ACTN|nr:hypothetical protein [Actinomadura barringtoniae]MBO2455379.1 hypothetical protein [Actinomadura barringtoniae]
MAALAAHLKGRELVVQEHPDGVVVRNPHHRELADTVTCRERPDDGDRLWFFTSWNDPIAEADRITDAGVTIAGYLKYDGEAAEA